VPTPTQPFGETVLDADVIVIATNHSEFERPGTLEAITDSGASECLIVDPWNCLGAGQVFAYAAEIAALTAAQ
jgi:UDP-N-acetyl-D-mannosaminuronic acid dehydrogenase